MKKSSFTPEQIAFALKQADSGTPVAQIVRKLEISEQTFYRWKKKYAGLMPSDLKRLHPMGRRKQVLKANGGGLEP